MLKQLLIFLMAAGIIYGIYTLLQKWPVEVFLVISICLIGIIGKWLIDGEKKD